MKFKILQVEKMYVSAMKVMITEFAPEVIQQQVCPKRTLKL